MGCDCCCFSGWLESQTVNAHGRRRRRAYERKHGRGGGVDVVSGRFKKIDIMTMPDTKKIVPFRLILWRSLFLVY
jgi:hypothetical protein